MKSNIKKIIFGMVSILLLICILYTIYKMWIPNRSIEKFSTTYPTESSDEYPKNLIVNGSFQDGKRPLNYISQSGSNKIVVSTNPTSSGYSLLQEKTDTNTYYELQSNCTDNTKYLFYIWTSFANKDGSDYTSNIDLSKSVQVRVLKSDSTNDLPQVSYQLEKKVSLKDSPITWYLISYSFQTGGDTDNLMNIYLNYTNSLQSDYQYFTGLALYKVLPDAQNFIYNDRLNLFLDGYHFESSSKNWSDLSTFSNNFSFSNNPYINTSKGFVNTKGNVLTGPESSRIFGTQDKPFTWMFVMSQNDDTSEYSGDETSSNKGEMSLLLVPGNNNYSLKLSWDAEDQKFICYLPSDKKVESSIGLTLNNKSVITIQYFTHGVITILQDGNKILSTQSDKLYFSTSDKVKVNPDGNLNIDLYALLNYERILSKNELSQVREYFITNQDKDFSQTSTYSYTSDIPSNFYSSDDQTISSYNRRDKYSSWLNGDFNSIFGNQSYMFKVDPKNCVPACNTMCNMYIDDTQKYHECLRNCKNVIPSCKNYCDDSANKNSIMCESTSCTDGGDPTKDCPIAYKRNEQYMVYIKPESYYAKKYNYSGEKSYGKKLENASKMYKDNFPKCQLPSILTPGEGNNTLNACPFVIHEANPCFHSACAGVNWDIDNYKDLQMSDRCKKSVSYYCQINNELDDMCACWKPENENNQKCIDYRKFFENPKDYCKPSQFNIEDHPSYNKFIRKDKIPCFGCNVE